MSSINKSFSILVLALLFSTAAVFAQTDGASTSSASLRFQRPATKAEGSASGSTFVGRGFGRYESVTLELLAYGENGDAVRVMTWEVMTNGRGAFTAEIPGESLAQYGSHLVLNARADKSGATAQSVVSPTANPSGTLEQCANGSFAAPVPCTGGAWQTGNVGQNSGHYYEGDSMPYRVTFDNLVVGTPNTIQLEWDTTQGGKHAIDYLTSYDRTESAGNDPCSGVTPVCGAVSTFPIPADTNVTSLGVPQVAGSFTMWGGTITAVSAYTLAGSYAGNSSTSVIVTFTPTQANPVLAFGGHIASRQNWANLGGSASDINGSPYHMRNLGINGQGGNQDRSLSNVAVRLDTSITISQVASPKSNGAFGFTSAQLFAPTQNVSQALADFSLYDDGTPADATTNSATFNNLLAPLASGTFTVTQSSTPPFYQRTGISCTVNGTSTFTAAVVTGTTTINLNYGDSVNCVYTASVPTAADATASGVIATRTGLPIVGARVTIQNLSTGAVQRTTTDATGRYTFENLESGDAYVVSVSARRFKFSPSSQTIWLNDSLTSVNFLSR